MDNCATAALIYDEQALSGDVAARDVVEQLDAVGDALRGMGVDCVRIPVDLRLDRFKRRMAALRPDLVFNLVESLDGSDRLQTLVPMLLEDWRIPFTGCGSAAMYLTNHKILSKRILAAHGLSYPACAWLERGVLRYFPERDAAVSGAWIIKTRDSHASLFLDDASVVAGADAATLSAMLADAEEKHGQPFFAERFIEGREFNISVLEMANSEPRVLPAAEISFESLPAGKPAIVGYAAKWDEDSPEFQATPRTFDLRPGDDVLVGKLTEAALSAWRAFSLSGYARVDFRVDGAGTPFILEANANPCLSPDAGLAAAAEQGGIAYAELIRTIMEATRRN